MKKNYNKKDILKTLFYIFMLFSFFEPEIFSYYNPMISNIFSIVRYISFSIILILVLSSKSFSKVMLYITLYMVIYFISSMINDIKLINIINICTRLLAICFIADYGIRKNTKNFLDAICFILNILIIWNFITLILYPKGMYISNTGYYMNWVLGYKNIHIAYILPCLILNIVRKTYLNEKSTLFYYLIITVSTISTIIVNNSTGIVGILLLLSIVLLPKLYDNIKLFNSKNYFIAYIGMYVGIVLLRLQNIFRFLIVDMLHKDLTFTGRIYIWDKVIEAIKSKIVLGYGHQTFQYTMNVFTTHNTLLDVLYRTGIIGFIIYIVLLVAITIQLYNHRNNKISKILSVGLFIYFIMMINEAYSMIYYLYLFVICYNVKYLLGSDHHE